jgi:D-serine deaminase-like pyridoxal phosphate-dependent protein
MGSVAAVGAFVEAYGAEIAAGAAVASAGVSAYGAHQQGVATSNEDKQKARVEAQAATQKQIDMRQRMLASLATQDANTLGAISTSKNTGFGANTNRQILQQQNDLLANSANASAQVSLLDQAASNAVSAGNLAATGDIVTGAGKAFGGFSSGSAPSTAPNPGNGPG